MPLNTVAWKASITGIQAISIGSTIVRLAHRWCTKRMWWDDWIATIPLLGSIVYVVIMWLALGGTVASKSLNVLFSPWFGTLMFYTIVWVSRISLALSISRIFPPGHTCRRFAFVLAFLFLAIYIANVLMSTFDCYKSSSAWYNMVFADCLNKKGAMVGVYVTVVLDLLADLSLVVSPLAMLWKIKLPTQQRRLILALFSSSMLPLLSSIIYCIIWGLSPRIGPDSFIILRIMSQLQAGISLLVCNLLVVTMLFYRIVRRENVPDPAVEPAPPPPNGPPLNRRPASTEKNLSTSKNTSTAQTREMETRQTIDATTQQTILSPSTSLVLTSLYEESILQFSSGQLSTTREPSPSYFNAEEDEDATAAFLPAWSFSDKSITNSVS